MKDLPDLNIFNSLKYHVLTSNYEKMQFLETAFNFFSGEQVLSSLRLTFNLTSYKISAIAIKSDFALKSYEESKCDLFTQLTL